MPYCPKCDMEFVDGITTCSDCGGPLVESEEAYKKEMKKKMERAYQKRMEDARQYYQADELIQREVPLERAQEGRVPDPDDLVIPTFTLDYSAPAPQPKRSSVPKFEAAAKDIPPRSFTSEEMKEQRAAAADRYAQALRMAEAQRLLGHYTGAARRPAQEQPSAAPSASNRGMAPNPSQNPSQHPDGSGQPAAAQPRMTTGTGVYVSSRQKGEDRRSSSLAFALVGGLITLFSLACWVGLFRLPMTGTSLYFFQGVLQHFLQIFQRILHFLGDIGLQGFQVFLHILDDIGKFCTDFIHCILHFVFQAVFAGKQRFPEGFGIKIFQIVDGFPGADQFYRQIKFGADADDHAAFGGAVQFGQDHTGNAGGVAKNFRLRDGILPGGGVQHQQHFF